MRTELVEEAKTLPTFLMVRFSDSDHGSVRSQFVGRCPVDGRGGNQRIIRSPSVASSGSMNLPSDLPWRCLRWCVMTSARSPRPMKTPITSILLLLSADRSGTLIPPNMRASAWECCRSWRRCCSFIEFAQVRLGGIFADSCGRFVGRRHLCWVIASDAVAVFAACVMTGTLAASVKTPITSILLAVEMSGTLTHMLPVGRRFHRAVGVRTAPNRLGK